MANPAKDLPKVGDTLRCQKCGMELKVSRDCNCDQGKPCLECCGQPLTKQA